MSAERFAETGWRMEEKEKKTNFFSVFVFCVRIDEVRESRGEARRAGDDWERRIVWGMKKRWNTHWRSCAINYRISMIC